MSMHTQVRDLMVYIEAGRTIAGAGDQAGELQVG